MWVLLDDKLAGACAKTGRYEPEILITMHIKRINTMDRFLLDIFDHPYGMIIYFSYQA
jgi:hypothetical protein